ncbi:rhodanese-like domain-containing protein [Pseudogulbenkiania sp. MAI-1]|uniref:rhodanese-like domain-containing protein n=1 Tax=Pseudogulbenkiania sp. MAI-1 TaxID=990370 RepID=UPI00045E95B5|nr:rhodanese-like domain-containing protein [Pseudogulbenkiania sp. MAI-1]
MRTAQDLVREARSRIVELPLPEAATWRPDGVLVVDVREPTEYAAGHVPGAVNLPRGVLEFQLEASPELANRHRPVLLYCQTSACAALAAQSLLQMGYTTVCSIAGGFDDWLAAGLPVEKPAPASTR